MLDSLELENHYRHILTELGKKGGMLEMIFTASSLIQMVQRSDWQDIFSLVSALVSISVAAHLLWSAYRK